MDAERSMREAYGDALVKLGKEYPDIVVLDADLAHATCSNTFQTSFPNRFFNMGIAEQNLFCVSAGMANSGLVPFASTFAIFAAGRAYEPIRNGICYSKSNVKIMGCHAGITCCGDGGTHQCIEDLALMRVLPNMTIFCPCDYDQTQELVKAAYELKGPVYLRIARPPVPSLPEGSPRTVPGKAQVLAQGKDICIIATGIMVHTALNAAQTLKKSGIKASVLNIHTIKPFDEETVLDYAKRCGVVITIEEHSTVGGLGSAVSDALIGKAAVKIKKLGVNDRFGQSGLMPELMKEYCLTPEFLAESCRELLK